MDTTMVLLLMIAAIIAICLVLGFNESRRKSNDLKRLMKDFSQRATQREMIFTSQEIFENCLLGLDGVKRRLLILDSSVTPYRETYIDLSKVKRCVSKHYFKRCYENDAVHTEATDCCSLSFEYFDGRKIEIHFSHEQQDIAQLNEMSAKTRKWAALLSKMLSHRQDDNPPGQLRLAS